MPTRNISLTPKQDARITRLVKSGEYQNASEVMRDALRALDLRRAEDAHRLKELRAEIAKGDAAFERGDYVTLEPHEIRPWIQGRLAAVRAGIKAEGAVGRTSRKKRP